MSGARQIEIFSAGCPICKETIGMVANLACSSCEVSVLDMSEDDVAKRAMDLGIKSIPSVVIDGELAGCCTGRGVDEAVLRQMGVGEPIS